MRGNSLTLLGMGSLFLGGSALAFDGNTALNLFNQVFASRDIDKLSAMIPAAAGVSYMADGGAPKCAIADVQQNHVSGTEAIRLIALELKKRFPVMSAKGCTETTTGSGIPTSMCQYELAADVHIMSVAMADANGVGGVMIACQAEKF